MPSANVLAVIGAGFLGREVARAWDGPVVATTRQGRWEGSPAPAHVRSMAFDLTAPEPLDVSALADATHLLVCIAAGREQDRRAVYVEGTRRLLAAVTPPRGRPWRRVVYVSSTSALPAFDGWLDEDTRLPPDDERGRVQREAEDGVRAWAQHHGIPYWILRLGGLYGPGRDLGAIYRRRHATPLPGHGHVPTNLIHRDDAQAAILAALRAPAEREGLLHVVDDDHTPRRTMYERLAAQRGEPPVAWSEPVPPGTAPSGKRISNHRVKSQLGLRLRYPTHSGANPCATRHDD